LNILGNLSRLFKLAGDLQLMFGLNATPMEQLEDSLKGLQ